MSFDMRRFWTADNHYGHSNIIEYCGRPFRDCHHMNVSMIREANMRIGLDDVCISVGDFCVRGGAKFKDFRDRLNGTWVFIRGNHDKNNGVKTIADWMFTRVADTTVFVSHIPYFYRKQDGTATHLLPDSLVECVEETCDFAVCGHVHEKWAHSFEGKIPCINVGVDVHRFMPIADDELVGLYRKISK